MHQKVRTRKVPTFVLILLLCSVTVVFPNVGIVSASEHPLWNIAHTIAIYSPLNRTYDSRLLTLNFTFSALLGTEYALSFNIDGEYEDDVPFEIENPTELHVFYKATGFVTLPELTEGSHNLTILIADGSQRSSLSYADTVYFTLNSQLQDSTIPEFPSWTILPLVLTITLFSIVVKRKLQKNAIFCGNETE
ncbi:MAG: hypothetical protein CW716_10995 [Candidatus Bathyarchaeum sp.]|nr:MAG: hypothetical protein CW716_10995 [Candidatus Bathyarchaeum sp.]